MDDIGSFDRESVQMTIAMSTGCSGVKDADWGDRGASGLRHGAMPSHSRREEEDESQYGLVGVEAQFAALFLKGFFSPSPGQAIDPDGAGGALTTAPVSETASQILFQMHNRDLMRG